MQHTRLIDYIGEVETDPERHIVRACRQCPESLADPISRAVSAGTLFLFDLDKNAELLPLVKRNVIAHVGPKGHDYNLGRPCNQWEDVARHHFVGEGFTSEVMFVELLQDFLMRHAQTHSVRDVYFCDRHSDYHKMRDFMLVVGGPFGDMNMAVDLTIGEAFEDKAQRASEMMRAHGDDAFSKKRDQVIDEFMADGHMVLSIMCPPQLRNPGVMNALRQSWIESPDGYVSRQTDQLRSTRRYFRHQMQRLFYVFDLFQNIMTIHRSAILGANESADHAKQFLKLGSTDVILDGKESVFVPQGNSLPRQSEQCEWKYDPSTRSLVITIGTKHMKTKRQTKDLPDDPDRSVVPRVYMTQYRPIMRISITLTDALLERTKKIYGLDVEKN